MSNTQASVTATYRYLHNRSYHLDYKGAITSNLPIDSQFITSDRKVGSTLDRTQA